MEWMLKGLLTMLSVALVLALAKRWGGTAAGLMAGLPTTTAPALGWTATEHGTRFAADAATSSVAACAMTAVFALAYAHAAAVHRPQRVALAWGVVAALTLTGPVLAAGGQLATALTLALACGLVALAAWPEQGLGAGRPSASSWSSAIVVPAAAAGSISAGLVWVGPLLGPVATGLLSSLPIVSVAAAAAAHASGGAAALRQLLHGTVLGLFGRMAFGAVFAVEVTPLGALWALGLAALATAFINLVLIRALARYRHHRVSLTGGCAASNL